MSHVDPGLFVGRQKSIAGITRRHQQGRSWMLGAGRRNGKTMLLRRVGALDELRIGYVDCQALDGGSSARTFFQMLGSALGCGIDTPDLPSLEIAIEPDPRPVTILVDEPEGLLRHDWGVPALENLRALVSNGRVSDRCGVGLAGGLHLSERLVSAGSPIGNVCERLELEALTYGDTQSLVAMQFSGQEADEISDFVWNWAGGHPYLAQVAMVEVERRGWPLAASIVRSLSEKLAATVSGWIGDADASAIAKRAEAATLGLSRQIALVNSGLFRREGTDLIANGALISEAIGPWTNPRPSLAECLKTGECNEVEFKSSLRWDFALRSVSKTLEGEVARAVAAMANSEGGTVVVGVTDDRTVVGIEPDLPSLGRRQNRDGWELKLRHVLGERLGREFAVVVAVAFEQHTLGTIALIHVPKSRDAVWLQESLGPTLVVRAGNTSQTLDARESHAYLRSRS